MAIVIGPRYLSICLRRSSVGVARGTGVVGGLATRGAIGSGFPVVGLGLKGRGTNRGSRLPGFGSVVKGAPGVRGA